MQRAAAREMRQQVLHLVRQHAPDWTAEPQDEAVSDWAERVGQQVADVRRRIGPGLEAAVSEAWRKGWTAAELEAHWKEHGLPLDGGGTHTEPEPFRLLGNCKIIFVGDGLFPLNPVEKFKQVFLPLARPAQEGLRWFRWDGHISFRSAGTPPWRCPATLCRGRPP